MIYRLSVCMVSIMGLKVLILNAMTGFYYRLWPVWLHQLERLNVLTKCFHFIANN